MLQYVCGKISAVSPRYSFRKIKMSTWREKLHRRFSTRRGEVSSPFEVEHVVHIDQRYLP